MESPGSSGPVSPTVVPYSPLVRPVHVKNLLRDIQTNRANLRHGRLPQVVLNTSTLAHRCRRGASTPSPKAGTDPRFPTADVSPMFQSALYKCRIGGWRLWPLTGSAPGSRERVSSTKPRVSPTKKAATGAALRTPFDHMRFKPDAVIIRPIQPGTISSYLIRKAKMMRSPALRRPVGAAQGRHRRSARAGARELPRAARRSRTPRRNSRHGQCEHWDHSRQDAPARAGPLLF